MAAMFEGCYTAIVTPFLPSGEVDWDELDGIVEEQVAAGVAGVIACGTTGESPTLSHEEHREVIRRVVARAAHRTHVMAGCGSNATSEALALTRFAAEVGADSTLQVVPYYNKPSQDGLYRHFAAIAGATHLPIVLYNIPGRTGINMAPATVARLAQLPTVRGIKEASGSLDQVSEILATCAIDLLSGDDSLTLPMLAVGGRGVISVASNIIPQDVVALVARFLAGDAAGARELHLRQFPLVKALFCEPNPVPVKHARKLLGRGSDGVRLPLSPMSADNAARLRAALVGYGLLDG